MLYQNIFEYLRFSLIWKLKNDISSILEEFEKSQKQKRLKIKAWMEDLKPILQNVIEEFVEQL